MGLLKGSIEIGFSELFGEQPNEARTLSFVLLPSGVFSWAQKSNGRGDFGSGYPDIRPIVPEHLHHLIPPEFLAKSDEPAEP